MYRTQVGLIRASMPCRRSSVGRGVTDSATQKSEHNTHEYSALLEPVPQSVAGSLGLAPHIRMMHLKGNALRTLAPASIC